MNLENYVWQSDFAREHEAKGMVKGLLRVLKARGVRVPAEAQERIMRCTDPEQLESWGRRVATIHAIEELFA